MNIVPISETSQFTVSSSGRLEAVGLDLQGELVLQTNGVVDAPISVGPTGQVTASSGTGTIQGDVTVARDATDAGRIALVVNSVRLNGTGVVTNSGLIEGGGTSNNVSTYFNLNLTNTADGVVRAFRNGTTTNTFFQITESVQNDGVMEAVGANLYFNTASLDNGGLLRTVDDTVASKLVFIGGTSATDRGGTTIIDGALNRLEVSGASNVNLGTLSFTNGGGGFVSGSGSVVAATNVVPISETSRFSVVGGGRLDALGVDLAGEVVLQSNAVVNAPITVESTGQITANSATGSLNDDVTIRLFTESAARTLLTVPGQPTNEYIKVTQDLMQELARNYTIVIVTHNMQQAARVSDFTAFLTTEGGGQPGRLVEFGPRDEIFTTPKDKRTQDYITGRFG
ncbi:MAG: hypothetical protein IH897_09275 [Planctomycetes bacterium]|nr:hypothetical protein [Planctomycetota bacterium]